MNIQQWQEKFLTEIYNGGITNIFPSALIRMIASADTEDAEEFKEFVLNYFKQYESITISSTGSNSELRNLILSLGEVSEPEPPLEEGE